MASFNPQSVLKLLIDKYGQPTEDSNQDDQDMTNHLITIIEDKLDTSVSLESYETLVFSDECDEDDDDDYIAGEGW